MSTSEKQQITIETKMVKRWFAPYIDSHGETRLKGFGSKMAAARFLARQALLDMVFGEKRKHELNMNGDTYSWFVRDVPDEKTERAEKFAEHFPLEECETPGTRGYYGEPITCDFDCENHGYARCQAHKWMESKAQSFYWGRG